MRFYGALRVVHTPFRLWPSTRAPSLERAGFTPSTHAAPVAAVQMPFKLLLTPEKITKATKIT
jgi:hypothetical protein